MLEDPSSDDLRLGPRLALALGLLLLVLGSTLLRVDTARGDPNFAASDPQGLWKSDPALLLYLTERVIDSGGSVPTDWRADRRVQHPYSTDLPAEFTVGQEFLLAWTQLGLRSLGRAPPLHETALWLFGFLASLGLVGVYGLARELTLNRCASRLPALGAALLWLILPANYRTVGFLLVREDLALPALSLGLWLLARGVRKDTLGAWFLAGLALAVALATWHAMGFFLVILLMAPVVHLARTGASPFASRAAGAVLIAPIAATLLVPALRTAGTFGSLPALLAVGLFAAGFAQRRGARHATRVAFGVGAAGLLVILAGALNATRGAVGAYAHVWDVLLAKLRLGGAPPLDPNEISFDARLLWQGPFETLSPAGILHNLGWGLPLCLGAVALLWWAWGPRAKTRSQLSSKRGAESSPFVTGAEAFLAAACVVSLPAAWLVARVVILPGLLLPVLGAVLLGRFVQGGPALHRRRPVMAALAVVLMLQGSMLFLPWIRTFESPWYKPPGRQAEIAALVDWVSENLDASQAISTDFMIGPALLAHCGNPIVLQPKYETDRSRRQAERFLTTFFQGSPAEFLALIRTEFKTPYLLIDRYTLGYLSRWTAGLRADEQLPVGSAAELFLSQDSERLENIAGTKLLYRSPGSIQQSDGSPYDFFCLYSLE